jgi:oxygen-independent coproporphyrinogen-3 oxidase
MEINKPPGLYIHFPFCKKKCGFCAFYSQTNWENYAQYMQALFGNIETLPFFFNSSTMPSTLYLGGGTPSLFPLKDLESILHCLPKSFSEITLEANPGTLCLEKLQAYKNLGINRISLGIQSLQDEVLQFLGRIHSAKQAWENLEQTASLFDNFAVDILYAVPGFPIESLKKTIVPLLENFRPPHISAYSLTIEEGTPFYSQGIQTSEEQFCEEYTFLHQYLESKGYVHYEVSNFSQPGYTSKHNEKYWDRSWYLGIGPAAHSLWENKRFFFENFRDFFLENITQKYQQAEVLSAQEIREEEIMLHARTLQGIPKEWLAISPKYLQELEERQLIHTRDSQVFVSWKGWMVLNSLTVALMS